MPLKLVPPRKGKSSFYSMRGTHLGVYTDRSTGASERATAQRVLNRRKRQIESGKFEDPQAPGFAGAASAYLKAGGERRFVAKLLHHFKNTPLVDIDQGAIDHAAETLYPKTSPATRNRQVYSPISAILKRAGHSGEIKRPIGSQGTKRTAWLETDDGFRLLARARKISPEFGLLCLTLIYTGLRLSEALEMRWEDVRLKRSFVYIPDTKTGEPRAVHLTKELVKGFKSHPRGIEKEGYVFKYHKSGALYSMLRKAAKEAGIKLPMRTAFHIFRHTYGTWMRHFGGLDTIGLVRTGTWADTDSVERYSHSFASDEARRADLLPTPKRKRA